MTLRKITIDNSEKYIPSRKKSPSESSHDLKPKTVSNPKQQKMSQNKKKLKI